jgi:nitroreductase
MIRNEVTAAIAERRSIRKYTARKVTAEELETILECGILAPSGMNTQGWFVAAVQDPALLKEMSALQKEAVLAMPGLPPVMQERAKDPAFDATFGAPVVLIVTADSKRGSGDACLLTENMVLAAQSLGLGTCISGSIAMAFQGEKGAKLLGKLGVPEGYSPVVGITLGEAAEAPEAKPREKKYIIV